MFCYRNKSKILIRYWMWNQQYTFSTLSFSHEESESERKQHSRVEFTEQCELQHGPFHELCDCAERTTGSDVVSRDAEPTTPPAPTAATPRLRCYRLRWWEVAQVLFFSKIPPRTNCNGPFTLTDTESAYFTVGLRHGVYSIPRWAVPGAGSVTVGVNKPLHIDGIGCIALGFTVPIIFANRGWSHKTEYSSMNQFLIHLPYSWFQEVQNFTGSRW